MAEQMEKMTEIRRTELPSLLSELEETQKRISYALCISQLSEKHIALNNETFNWPQKIIPILQESDSILGEAKGKAQDILKERRGRFEQELHDIKSQVDELKEVGDLDEMPFYVKKVQALFKQLQASSEAVAAFNKEEGLYGWKASNYPQKDTILASLEPYQTLYTNAVIFQKNYKKWMDGGILELDAEVIEMEVDNLKREMNGVLATLGDAKAPRKIASQIGEKIDEFMKNIPLIRVLCNPGMRARHWAKLSDVSGMEIYPDATTSLRKMLKMNLDPFIPAFEEISGNFIY